MDDQDGKRLTELLREVQAGGDGASDRLFEAVYGQLLDMARREFRREAPGHTLQPTALVNEAWMRLDGSAQGFDSQAHFFGAAALAMRRILIDHARRAQAAKRDGGGEAVTLTDVEGTGAELSVLEVEDALQALEAHDPRLAAIVQLRFFGGLTVEEVARVQGVSPATVKRDWTYARAWLFDRMDHPQG
jgi:RNA polymerase sigma factor (TIGR02999 family)